MKYILHIIYIMLLSNAGLAQSDFFREPVFSISLVNHAVGVSPKNLFKRPFNFGVSISADFPYNREQFQRIEVGWYRHKNLSSAIWVKTDYVRRFGRCTGVFADVRGGIGYIRDFNDLDSYELTSDGTYQLKKGHGKGGLIGGLGVAGGYTLSNDQGARFSPFIDYQGFVQYPYSKIAPVFPHSLLSVGTRIQN